MTDLASALPPVELSPASGTTLAPQEDPRPLLTRLRALGVLTNLDLYLALTLGELAGDRRPTVLLALALASRRTGEGHVCLDLSTVAGAALQDPEGNPTDAHCPPLQVWVDALRSSPLVGNGTDATPLVLDSKHRLYLRRYWQHEQRVAELLFHRATSEPNRLHPPTVTQALERLFGAQGRWDGQRIAAQLALVGHLTLISGGPGTGKTSTVVRLLALLVENARALELPPPRTLLLAPTGKAAARLVESICKAKAKLNCTAETKQHIEETASTIHRALGTIPGSRTQFRHGLRNPLAADVIVVDEASMIDLALMRRLLEAVPPEARLILLGDRNQLASVEAGSVLGDLSINNPSPTYSVEIRRRIQEAFGAPLPSPPSATPLLDRVAPPLVDLSGGLSSPLADATVELTESHRFGPNSGIGGLARAIENGSPDGALTRLRSARLTDVSLVERNPQGNLGALLEKAVLTGYRGYLRETRPERALAALDQFRLLCAHRQGPAGVEGLNAQIETALAHAGLIRKDAHFYPGRPIIVVENDYSLSLFNGDIGIALQDPTAGLRVYFADSEGGTRSVAPSRLPRHETVFAMSIHKSQGSEFEEVAVVLPSEASPLLTRELLYTAVTRAKKRVVIYGTERAVRIAISRTVARASGLRDALIQRT